MVLVEESLLVIFHSHVEFGDRVLESRDTVTLSLVEVDDKHGDGKDTESEHSCERQDDKQSVDISIERLAVLFHVAAVSTAA